VKGFNGDGVALQTQLSFPAGGNPEPSGGLALDAQGRLYFSDTHNNRIRRIEFTTADFNQGVVTTLAGTGEAAYGGDGGPAIEAQINYPQDIEIGPDGNVYFADTNNHRVRMINLTDGTIQTVAGTGEKGYSGDGAAALDAQLNRPFGIAFDAAGDLYISDTFNSLVRKVKR
jgi:sugar lactone lactonase YvrE